MKTLNILMSVLLALATAFASMFWLGSAEQHKLMLETAFWSTFRLRFFTIAVVGLTMSGIWLLLLLGLERVGFIKNGTLGQVVLIALAASMIGVLLGTAVFYFA